MIGIYECYKVIQIFRMNLKSKLRTKHPLLSKIKNDVNPLIFKKEYSTIKICLPRRMGNTTLALTCLGSFAHTIIVVNPRSPLKCKKMFYSNFKEFEGITVDTVVVDGFSYMTKEEIDNIYNINAKFFILLG